MPSSQQQIKTAEQQHHLARSEATHVVDPGQRDDDNAKREAEADEENESRGEVVRDFEKCCRSSAHTRKEWRMERRNDVILPAVVSGKQLYLAYR